LFKVCIRLSKHQWHFHPEFKRQFDSFTVLYRCSKIKYGNPASIYWYRLISKRRRGNTTWRNGNQSLTRGYITIFRTSSPYPASGSQSWNISYLSASNEERWLVKAFSRPFDDSSIAVSKQCRVAVAWF
jgi:hypothetical protein